MDNIAESINKFIVDKELQDRIAKNAMFYLKKNHDHIKAVDKMLKICL